MLFLTLDGKWRQFLFLMISLGLVMKKTEVVNYNSVQQHYRLDSYQVSIQKVQQLLNATLQQSTYF